MKAIRIYEPGRIVCEETSKPTPGPGEALIRIVAAGICGSDINTFRGTNGLVSYPRLIGHELAGIVESIPEDNIKGIQVGDRVIIDPYLYCGECYPCSVGRTNCCNNLRVLGVHIDGGMAEYHCHPADMLIRIPEYMDWTAAAIAEPLTISLHGIHRGGLKAGEYCAIYGAGTIGILAGMVAQAYGAHAIVIDLLQERLAFAKSVGIEFAIDGTKGNVPEIVKQVTNGKMCQLVMECSGANTCIRETLDLVCHAGRITLTGWPHTETMLPTDIITRKEIDIRGARTSVGEFEEAIELICSGRIDVSSILTKTVSISEAAETLLDMEMCPERYLKVVVRMDQ